LSSNTAGAATLSTTLSRSFFWANVWGYSHTAKGGNKAWGMDGRKRMDIMVETVEKEHADLGVFSEFESPQASEFLEKAGDAYGLVYPGHDTRNCIFYKKASYEKVAEGSLAVPYFGGRMIRIPIGEFMDKATGKILEVIAVHNPADTASYPNQAQYRAEALSLEVQAIHALEESNREAAGKGNASERASILIAGDWNEGETAAQEFARYTDLISPIVELHRGHLPIDQLFASPGVHFTDYQPITGPNITRSTDHRVVYTATFDEERPK
jgi:hypothetical protein